MVLLNLLILIASAELRIAVIDGGFNQTVIDSVRHCDDRKEVRYIAKSKNKMYIQHGSNVVGLIEKYAGDKSNYCFILISGIEGATSSIKSIAWAIYRKADVINYSASGKENSKLEYELIKRFLKKSENKYFCSTGNGGTNLNKNCTEYPSCYTNVNISRVTHLLGKGNQHKEAIISDKDGSGESVYGIEMRGTSQSTAIETGRYIKKYYDGRE